jgi:hypothetical protein
VLSPETFNITLESKMAEMKDLVISDTDSATIKETGGEEKSEVLDSNRNSSFEPTQEVQAEPEVLTGFALNLLVAGISLAGFIYSLDISIIVTVSWKVALVDMCESLLIFV